MPQQDASRNWLPSLSLVLALHIAVWWGMTHFKSDTTRPQPLPVINAVLLPPPEPPRVEPPQPRPEPPKPQPQRQPERPPKPLPVLRTQAADAPELPPAPVEEVKLSPPPPVIAPPAPSPRPAAEPVLELPRYNAAYLSNPPPAYPMMARRRGIEGTALIQAEVSAEGRCLRAELKKSSGADSLDQAALEAVKKWRFVPAKRGSQAVTAWVEVPITFKLDN